jgi:hypothetical protein
LPPETNKKLTIAVRACGTSLTGLFGVGPVIAATVTGDVRDVSRFRGRDRFAADDGTAPIEVSSGNRKVHRLSRRGNRRLNHAIDMAAITQIRCKHSEGRACYDKKIAGGKTPEEALRALRRPISDAICRCLKADAARTAASSAQGPGGQPGNDSVTSAAGSHPGHQLFGQATPGPATTLRRPADQRKKASSHTRKKTAQPLDTKGHRYARLLRFRPRSAEACGTGCYAYYLAGIVQSAQARTLRPWDKAVASPRSRCPACRARPPSLVHLTRTCTPLRRPQVSRKHTIVMAGPDMPGSAAR